jgi:hypothetical protein
MVEAEFDEIEQNESELDLSEDDSLPWLEANEEDDAAGDLDTTQIIGFAVLLLALLAAVIGAIWFFSNRPSDTAFIADGSIIEAPAGPIKERPTDAGGKEFAGTGNVAPVVGEGGTREGVMDTGETGNGGASGSGSTAPGDASSASSDGSPGALPSGAASTGGVGVQLAAYTSRARAEQGWADLSRRTQVLSGVRYRVVEGTIDIGTVYRLQAVTNDRASADQLCAALKAGGLDCQVKP